MLSIGKLGKGQESYYLEKVAEGAEDYYSGEGEEAGQWLGDAAAELGLSGEVEPDQLVAMLTGMNPATGQPLGLRAVAGNGAVPGFDLTFSAPKSVSLTWVLGGEEVATYVHVDVTSKHEVDALFEAEKVIVEIDHWGTHKTFKSFESDRERDAVAAHAVNSTR